MVMSFSRAVSMIIIILSQTRLLKQRQQLGDWKETRLEQNPTVIQRV